MDAKSYCDMINQQLTGWKATIYDTILATENLKEADKEEIQPVIENLNGLVAELNKNIEQLRTECPADWSPQKKTIDSKLDELKKGLERLSKKMDEIISDSTAWL